MLPKIYRLKKRSAFAATYKIGNSYHKNGVTLFCGKYKPDSETVIPTKIGFVVSKKIHKRAVKRNRIKRLMRESVRLYIKKQNNNLDTKYLSLKVASDKSLDYIDMIQLDKDFDFINKQVIDLLGIIE